jgi:hypothetical protein
MTLVYQRAWLQLGLLVIFYIYINKLSALGRVDMGLS